MQDASSTVTDSDDVDPSRNWTPWRAEAPGQGGRIRADVLRAVFLKDELCRRTIEKLQSAVVSASRRI